MDHVPPQPPEPGQTEGFYLPPAPPAEWGQPAAPEQRTVEVREHRVRSLRQRAKRAAVIGVAGAVGVAGIGVWRGLHNGEIGITQERHGEEEVKDIKTTYISPRDDSRFVVIGTELKTGFHDIFTTHINPPGLPWSIDKEVDITSTATANGKTSWFISNDGLATDERGENKPIQLGPNGKPTRTIAKRIEHPACTMPTDATPGQPIDQAYIAKWNKDHGGDEHCGEQPELEVTLGPIVIEGAINEDGFRPDPLPERPFIDMAFSKKDYNQAPIMGSLHQFSTAILKRQSCLKEASRIFTEQAQQHWQWIGEAVGNIPANRVNVVMPPMPNGSDRAAYPLGRVSTQKLAEDFALKVNLPPAAGERRDAWADITALTCEAANPDGRRYTKDDIGKEFFVSDQPPA